MPEIQQYEQLNTFLKKPEAKVKNEKTFEMVPYNSELAKSNKNAFIETPPELLANGMCLCDTCGEVASMDDDRCNSCGELIVIFKTK